MKPESRKALIFVLLGASAAMAVASIAVGPEPVSLRQAWIHWRAGLSPAQSPTLNILLQLRLPRTFAALLAGSALALAGCSFQALLRNPLAEPYTLGLAGAGAFGAWAATVLLKGTPLWVTVLYLSPVQVGAFVFGALDVLIIYLLAARRTRIAPSVLLLAGVTLGMLANAGILLMRYFAYPEDLMVMDRWLMGGVDVIGYDPVLTLLFGVAPCALVLLSQAGKYDQLGFNPEMAAGRGVHVKRLQAVTFLVGSLMTAVVVSAVGPIGFVGLVVPHAVRAVTGSRHRILMPISSVAGGGFLCFCDLFARKLFTGEMPIGIVTAILGGPFFLYLLLRKKSPDWA